MLKLDELSIGSNWVEKWLSSNYLDGRNTPNKSSELSASRWQRCQLAFGFSNALPEDPRQGTGCAGQTV